MFDVFLTSARSICIDAALLGGIQSDAILIISSSFILNPLSAMTSSNGCKRSKNPLSFTIKMSVALPPYVGETYEIAPLGVMATKALKV